MTDYRFLIQLCHLTAIAFGRFTVCYPDLFSWLHAEDIFHMIDIFSQYPDLIFCDLGRLNEELIHLLPPYSFLATTDTHSP